MKMLFCLAIAFSKMAFASTDPGYAFVGNIEGKMTVAQYDEGIKRGYYHATLDMFLHGQSFCVAGNSRDAYAALMGSDNFEKKATLRVLSDGGIAYRTDRMVCDESDDEGACAKGHVVPDEILIVIRHC